MVERIVRQFHPERVILFGSYARGTPSPDSDVDLLIIKDTPDRFIDRWSTVQRILSDRKRKIGVDTIVVTPDELSRSIAKGDPFANQVLTKGRVLHEA